MREIALHVLDIVQNALRADASMIDIELRVDRPSDLLTLDITDDGRSVPQSLCGQLSDPFVTERRTRSVGLGLALAKQSAELSGGTLEIFPARAGRGIHVRMAFGLSHVNRPPLGDMAGTLHLLVVCNARRDFVVRVRLPNSRAADFDTRQLRTVLRGTATFQEWQVSAWIRAKLDELFPSSLEEHMDGCGARRTLGTGQICR